MERRAGTTAANAVELFADITLPVLEEIDAGDTGGTAHRVRDLVVDPGEDVPVDGDPRGADCRRPSVLDRRGSAQPVDLPGVRDAVTVEAEQYALTLICYSDIQFTAILPEPPPTGQTACV